MNKVTCARKRYRKKIFQNIKHDYFEWLEYGLWFCFWLFEVDCEARGLFLLFLKSAPPTTYDTGRIPGTNHAWSYLLPLDFPQLSQSSWFELEFSYYKTLKCLSLILLWIVIASTISPKSGGKKTFWKVPVINGVLLFFIQVLIFMSLYKAVFPNKLELISKNPQGTHKQAQITSFIKRKFETTVIAELFGVLAETPHPHPKYDSIVCSNSYHQTWL